VPLRRTRSTSTSTAKTVHTFPHGLEQDCSRACTFAVLLYLSLHGTEANATSSLAFSDPPSLSSEGYSRLRYAATISFSPSSLTSTSLNKCDIDIHAASLPCSQTESFVPLHDPQCILCKDRSLHLASCHTWCIRLQRGPEQLGAQEPECELATVDALLTRHHSRRLIVKCQCFKSSLQTCR
jgi:hypothetical protein